MVTILGYFQLLHHRKQHSLTVILEYNLAHQALTLPTYLSRPDSNYSDQAPALDQAARASVSHYFDHFAFPGFEFASYVNRSLSDSRNLVSEVDFCHLLLQTVKC